MTTPSHSPARWLLLGILAWPGCAGPWVDIRERGDFDRRAYPIALVAPLKAEGEIDPDLAEKLRGWIEIELLERDFRLKSWAEVDEIIRGAGGDETQAGIFQACGQLGTSGFWGGRGRLEVGEEGVKDLTLVIRFHDRITREWVVELRGNHHAQKGASVAEEREAWIALIEEMVDQLPEED
ncbi:MAG: hypothetical protein O7H41_00200 [Planctomycetota bacterium]|nr:hypothetical protein [Planctomycetota bacterium]